MSDPILEVSDLTVHFDTYEGRLKVLNSVDLTVDEGETVALVGETGCGKSVTAETVLGMLARTPGEIVEGTVTYRGEYALSDYETYNRVRAEEMSMIFQNPMTHLSPVFTVGEMMADVMKYHERGDLTWGEFLGAFFQRDGTAVNREIKERCVSMLAQLQIPDPEETLARYPFELSGGMRQRVLIALALLNDPSFLIADEPTTALDVTVQEQILDILKERIDEQNLSVLYITHNLGVAREIADRIYVMYAGSIVETGRTETLFDSPLHPYTKGLIDSIPKLTRFDSEGIPGSVPDYTTPPSGCRFHPRCPAYIEGTCEKENPEPISFGGDHEVMCYLYEEGMDSDEATRIASSEIEYRPDVSDVSRSRPEPDASRGAGSR